MKKLLVIIDSETDNAAIKDFFQNKAGFAVETTTDLTFGFSALIRHNLIDAASKPADAKISLVVIDAEIQSPKDVPFESAFAMLQESKKQFGLVPLPKIIAISGAGLSAEQKKAWEEFRPELVIKGENFPLRLYQKILAMKEGKDGQRKNE